jgi:uncharacterized protein
MGLYEATIPVFTKFLRQVDRWLDKAVAYAEQRKFDPEILLVARLAPDQFSLLRQIQSACDHAKFTAARLTGKEPPSHPDTEKTLPEIRARLQTVIDYLNTFTREDFEGAEERRCTSGWMQGKAMRGGDYLDHVQLPQLHFHLTMAYAILRHNGVPLGKADYVGDVPFVS